MNYAGEITSDAMLYVPSFINTVWEFRSLKGA
jgi:hypothetical protein